MPAKSTATPEERLVMAEPIESAGDGIKRLQADLALAQERYLTAERTVSEQREREQLEADARDLANMVGVLASDLAAAEAERDALLAAIEQHARPLAEWDMLWIAPDGSMPGRVADARWARAHIDALLATLPQSNERNQP